MVLCRTLVRSMMMVLVMVSSRWRISIGNVRRRCLITGNRWYDTSSRTTGDRTSTSRSNTFRSMKSRSVIGGGAAAARGSCGSGILTCCCTHCIVG
uniref:Putative secreted peptide n=1 Tax=Anopheles braziliensis TaxID=58242 RepID=A0A2M3ZT29_9DIPT